MARPLKPCEHYDLHIARVTNVIRAVEVDEVRGEQWRSETLEALRRSRELLARAPPITSTPKAGKTRRSS